MSSLIINGLAFIYAIGVWGKHLELGLRGLALELGCLYVNKKRDKEREEWRKRKTERERERQTDKKYFLGTCSPKTANKLIIFETYKR